MQRKVIGLFVFGLFALCLVGCDDEGDGGGDNCNAFCNKAYDECSEEYQDEWDVDEDDVEDLLDECLDGCEPDEECEGLASCYEDAYNEAGLDDCIYDNSSAWDAYEACLLELDCEDFVAYDGCEDEYDEAWEADEDAYADCEDAWGDLDGDELDDLYSAMEDCDDEYDCDWD